MQRITITLDDDLMDELDQMIVEQGYQNRSEAIRDFTRAGMQQAAQKMGKSARLRRRAGLCLRPCRARSIAAPGRELSRPSRSLDGHASRSSRRRQLHGGDGVEGDRRRGPAFRRPHHRRARRAIWPPGHDTDGIEQESQIAAQECPPSTLDGRSACRAAGANRAPATPTAGAAHGRSAQPIARRPMLASTGLRPS